MPGFIIIGVILAVIGALLMSVENFVYIFSNTRKKAKLEYQCNYAAFAGGDEHQRNEISKYIKKIRILKTIMFVGFLILIIGLGLQIIGATD
jgi:uncharacterized membrane protein